MLALGKLLYAILGLASVVGFLGYTVSLVGLWFAYRKVFKRCLLESRRPAAA